jgi:hypothetical protein
MLKLGEDAGSTKKLNQKKMRWIHLDKKKAFEEAEKMVEYHRLKEDGRKSFSSGNGT